MILDRVYSEDAPTNLMNSLVSACLDISALYVILKMTLAKQVPPRGAGVVHPVPLWSTHHVENWNIG